MADESHQHVHLEAELEDLRKELESFQKEKERIRAIVGKIGGVPKTQVHIINALFITIVAVSVEPMMLTTRMPSFSKKTRATSIGNTSPAK